MMMMMMMMMITISRLELGNNSFADFQEMLGAECLNTEARHQLMVQLRRNVSMQIVVVEMSAKHVTWDDFADKRIRHDDQLRRQTPLHTYSMLHKDLK